MVFVCLRVDVCAWLRVYVCDLVRVFVCVCVPPGEDCVLTREKSKHMIRTECTDYIPSLPTPRDLSPECRACVAYSSPPCTACWQHFQGSK